MRWPAQESSHSGDSENEADLCEAEPEVITEPVPLPACPGWMAEMLPAATRSALGSTIFLWIEKLHSQSPLLHFEWLKSFQSFEQHFRGKNMKV